MSHALHFFLIMHTAELDYTATTNFLVLNNQTRVKSVYVGIIDDSIFERSETFFGRLIAASVLPQNIHLDPRIASATIFDHKSMWRHSLYGIDVTI